MTHHQRWRAAGVLLAPAKAKIMPVGLDVLALSVILFGTWWTLVALPRWLGGTGPSPARISSRAFLPDIAR